MKIGIQGSRGAHSENAVATLYPKAEIITCTTFEDCFKLAKEKSFAPLTIKNNIPPARPMFFKNAIICI